MPSNAVDLQAVSIDPGKPKIGKGGKTFIRSIIKNNGPDILPKGEAKVFLTFPNNILALPTNRNFKSKNWRWGGLTRSGGFINLWFFSKVDLVVNENGEGFQFDVVGKNYGEALITLGSSLTWDSKSGDVNGENQSVNCVLKVEKK